MNLIHIQTNDTCVQFNKYVLRACSKMLLIERITKNFVTVLDRLRAWTREAAVEVTRGRWI